MQEVIQVALSFPAVVFTALLGVLGAYWGLVIVGALGIDMFDFDVDVDGVADGLAEGAAEGAMEGLADGAAEGAGETAGGVFALFNLGWMASVPITVSTSFLVLWSWTIAMLAGVTLGPLLSGVVATLFSIALFVVALVGGAQLAKLTVKPLSPVFATDAGEFRATMAGRTCTITTGRVDATFGQATVHDGGAGVLVQVRCAHDNDMSRGDEALILSYDADRDIYEVEPMDELLRDPAEAEAPAAAAARAST